MCVKNNEYQGLPKNVFPYHYNINLKLDLKAFTFMGKEDIHIDIKETTDKILLTSADIKIENVTFHNKNGAVIAAQKIAIDDAVEKVTVEFPEQLPLGKSGYLHFEFQGEINDKIRGLYRSKYIGVEGSIKYSAVTHFEPTCARRCFPCWDEPIFKSTFDITLQIAVGLTAVSNMPIKSKETSENTQTWTFETTPVMSSYLVAFVVGEFDYVEGKTVDGLVTRVYTPKGKSDQGQFALDVATKVIPLYNKYFGIPYALPKLDMCAVSDFAFGAMENWGLVIYRESAILMDQLNTSVSRKQGIVMIICHELAHKWFGNLVTMKWWDELWLKEGYATFMEFFSTDKLFPEYEIWTQFANISSIKALKLDALKNTHPIHVPVNHPSDIDEIFDEITYSKAPSVIRMLYSYIGDEDFKKGMNLYLNKFSYSNAVGEDLWTSLEEISNKKVQAIMLTWIKQKGFPTLSVQHRWDGNDLVLNFSQKKFTADGSEDSEKSLWMIPINLSTSQFPDKVSFSTIMNEKTKEVLLKDLPQDVWIKVNPGMIGYYRTNYSSDLQQLLIPAIENGTLPALDRLNIVDDMFAFAQTGHSSTVEYLRLIQSFKAEDDGTVWISIINSLTKIQLLIADSDVESSFEAFGRSLLRSISSKLGWDPKPNENHVTSILRPRVLQAMISFKDENTIQEAKNRFQSHISGKVILSPDLRNTVYRAILSTGNEETFETMMQLFQETDNSEEKERISRNLGALKDETLLIKVLEFAMSDKVRAQDTIFVMHPITESPKGRLLVWEFFKQNWNIFEKRYKGGILFPQLVTIVTENFVTEEKALEIEQFFDNHSTQAVDTTIQQAIECIRLNAAWLNRDKHSMKKYLSSQL